MKIIKFSFAGLNGVIACEKEVKITRNFQPFLREHQITDYVIEYLSCTDLPDLQGKQWIYLSES